MSTAKMSTLKRRMFGDVEVIIKDHLFVAARDFNTEEELTHGQVIHRLGWKIHEEIFGDMLVELDDAGLMCAAYIVPETTFISLEEANQRIITLENSAEVVEKHHKVQEPKLTTFDELYGVL